PSSCASRISSSRHDSQLLPAGLRSVTSLSNERCRTNVKKPPRTSGILAARRRQPMPSNLAVVVDPETPGRLVIRPVPEPTADRDEAVVRVHAISLNRGEVRRSGMAAAGWRPGWDLAGVVERAAADGQGPAVGTRVVGFLSEGAWAQRVVVPRNA